MRTREKVRNLSGLGNGLNRQEARNDTNWTYLAPKYIVRIVVAARTEHIRSRQFKHPVVPIIAVPKVFAQWNPIVTVTITGRVAGSIVAQLSPILALVDLTIPGGEITKGVERGTVGVADDVLEAFSHTVCRWNALGEDSPVSMHQNNASYGLPGDQSMVSPQLPLRRSYG